MALNGARSVVNAPPGHACVAQNVFAPPQVQSPPVICTQKAPIPCSSAHRWWLAHPHEPVSVGRPQRVGPPPSGWKHSRSPGQFPDLPIGGRIPGAGAAKPFRATKSIQAPPPYVSPHRPAHETSPPALFPQTAFPAPVGTTFAMSCREWLPRLLATRKPAERIQKIRSEAA